MYVEERTFKNLGFLKQFKKRSFRKNKFFQVIQCITFVNVVVFFVVFHKTVVTADLRDTTKWGSPKGTRTRRDGL